MYTTPQMSLPCVTHACNGSFKMLHSQLAKNAESENNRYNSNYIHFEQGVAYGFELAIEMLAKFEFWQNAYTNPPKFDTRRSYPNRPDFLVLIKNSNGSIQTDVYSYRFERGEWLVPKSFEVLYWQELPILPKFLLK